MIQVAYSNKNKGKKKEKKFPPKKIAFCLVKFI